MKDRTVSMVRNRERRKGEDGKEKGGKKGQLYKVYSQYKASVCIFLAPHAIWLCLSSSELPFIPHSVMA